MNTKAAKRINQLEKVANVLDSRFRVPGTRFRFGLDPVIGLIPFAGDITTAAISSALVMLIWQHGASSRIVVLMALNIIVDTVVGSIPVLGGIFDFFFKANNRNIKLLKEHYLQGKHTGSAKGLLLTILVIILLVMAAVIYGIWKLGSYLWSFL